MRWNCLLMTGLALIALTGSAVAQRTGGRTGDARTDSPSAAEVLEDLRLLTILNTLTLSQKQVSQLAGLAEAARKKMEAAEAQQRTQSDKLRDQLLALRRAMLKGTGSSWSRAEQAVRFQETASRIAGRRQADDLITSLAPKVRAILTDEQAGEIQALATEIAAQQAVVRVRADAQDPATAERMQRKITGLLDKVRSANAGKDRDKALKKLTGRMVAGLDPQSPTYQQQTQAVRALAEHAAVLSPEDFNQVKGELARSALPLAQQAMEQDAVRRAYDAPAVDPYRWFVEQVLLSPRAPTVLADKRASP
jgi:hypothetical protein